MTVQCTLKASISSTSLLEIQAIKNIRTPNTLRFWRVNHPSKLAQFTTQYHLLVSESKTPVQFFQTQGALCERSGSQHTDTNSAMTHGLQWQRRTGIPFLCACSRTPSCVASIGGCRRWRWSRWLVAWRSSSVQQQRSAAVGSEAAGRARGGGGGGGGGGAGGGGGGILNT
jgi:uncharacterized membrane protein YgcG